MNHNPIQSDFLKCDLCGKIVSNNSQSNFKRCKSCDKLTCKECWKVSMCFECFNKLPLDQQHLVDKFDSAFKTILKLMVVIFILVVDKIFKDSARKCGICDKITCEECLKDLVCTECYNRLPPDKLDNIVKNCG